MVIQEHRELSVHHPSLQDEQARSHLTIPIHLFTHPHLEKSPIFQSKTLTVKNKNKIFQKFLSPF